MYFFIVAVIVEIDDLNKTRKPQYPDGFVDYTFWSAPHVQEQGVHERSFWAPFKIKQEIQLGGKSCREWACLFVCLTNVFIFIALSHESNKILFLWFSFQFLWTFFYASSSTISRNRWTTIQLIELWPKGPGRRYLRLRRIGFLKLMSVLARYLTSFHPRGEIAYRTAPVSPEELWVVIFHSSPRKTLIPSPFAKKYWSKWISAPWLEIQHYLVLHG